MIKKIRYVFLLSILFTIGICTNSFARITTNDPTVNAGETVTITISSQEPVASGAIKLESNNGLTLKGTSGGTESADKKLVAFSKTNNATSGLVTYTFTAPDVSKDTVYKVVFSSQDMANENGTAIANSSATATVTVKAKAQTNNPSTPSGGNNGNSNTSGGNGSSGTTTPEPEKVKLQSLKINSTLYKNQLKTNLSVTVEGQEEISLLPKTSDGSSCKITNTTNKETKTVKSGATREN